MRAGSFLRHLTVECGVLSLLAVLAVGAPQVSGEPDWEELRRLTDPAAALGRIREWRLEALPLESQLRLYQEEYRILARLGRSAEAVEIAERWSELAVGSGDVLWRAEALVAAGRSLLALDRTEEAGRRLEQAIELLEPEGNPELRLEALLTLADVELKRARYEQSAELLDQAEALWRTGVDPETGARLWTLRAGIAFRQRRSSEVLEHRRQAVEQARLSGRESLLFQTLTNLARAYLDVHDYGAAVPIFGETAKLEGTRLDSIVNRIQLGISHFELNQFEEARIAFESARTAAAEVGSPRLEATALGELGLVAWEQDQDAATALAYFDEAIEMMEDIGDAANAITWRTNKAVVLRETDRQQEALGLYEALERDLLRLQGQVWPTIFKGMGQCQLELGRLEEAETTLNRCLVAARRDGDTKRIWECEQQRGRLFVRAGDAEAAVAAYQRAIEEIEKVRLSLLVGSFKADFFENKVQVYDEYATLLALESDREAAMRSFEIAERGRARSFLDELALAKAELRDHVTPELIEKEESLLERIGALRRELQEDPRDETRTALHGAEAELDGLALSAGGQEPLLTAYGVPAAPQEIQALLAPGEQLWAYWLGETRSHVWVLDSQNLRRFDLPPRAHVEGLVREAYAQLVDRSSTPQLRTLAETLIGPAKALGPLPESLIIVPFGILYYFPFEVLPIGDSILAEIATTSYVPSASSLVDLRARPASRSSRLLAVGGAPYLENNGRNMPAAFRGLGELPYSEEEMRAARSRYGWLQTDLLMGTHALESRIKALDLEAFSMLHFAAHGWIDSASRTTSGLLFGPEPPGGDDGLLEGREVRRLRMDADLVVLSACRSGLGELVTGEGMVGMTRAFLNAGSRSVVASLWNVNDRAAAEFMDVFYAGLASGLGRAAALREARLALLSDPDHAHPYFWAPWVLTGDGTGGVDFPMRWERWAVGALLAGLLAAILLLRRLHRTS